MKAKSRRKRRTGTSYTTQRRKEARQATTGRDRRRSSQTKARKNPRGSIIRIRKLDRPRSYSPILSGLERIQTFTPKTFLRPQNQTRKPIDKVSRCWLLPPKQNNHKFFFSQKAFFLRPFVFWEDPCIFIRNLRPFCSCFNQLTGWIRN